MAAIEVRAAKDSDIVALIALFEQSWNTHWSPHVSELSRRRFAEERPAKSYAEAMWADFVVATKGDVIVGVFHREGDYLHAIHVAVDQIGTGVGRVLMTQAEAEGARRLEVREFNAHARAFYERRGWREAGRTDNTEMGSPVVTIAMKLPA